MHIAGEDRAIGPVLDLETVGGEVDRGVAVVPLQRRYRVGGLGEAGGSGKGGRRRYQEGVSAHANHLTAPWTIFKRTPSLSTTLRSSRSALRRPARKFPSRMLPDTGPELANRRCLRSTSTLLVSSR